MNTAWFDWLIFGSYLAIVFAFGIYMSRKEGTPDQFFLAGHRLPWYAIALSLFAIWMFQDARTRGVSAVPYLLLMLCLGSIGALVYLVRREWASTTSQAATVLGD